MNTLTVVDILKATNGKLIYGNEDIECENFCRDTRTVKEGDIYVDGDLNNKFQPYFREKV